jgi:AcrR family transcriptional regulator
MRRASRPPPGPRCPVDTVYAGWYTVRVTSDSGLRDRLVEVGVELVAHEGTGALSLREVARRAGVSHGAPRRYFPTHRSLLAAIARRGYEYLGQRLTEPAADPDPRVQLVALGRRYLDFATTNRGMFALMFRHDLLHGGRAGLRDLSLPLFRTVVDLVARAGPTPDPTATAGALWANLHGIAQLWEWGSLQLAMGTDDAEPLLRAALDAHLGPAVHQPLGV